TALAEAGGVHLQGRRQTAELDLAGGVGGGNEDPEMPGHDDVPCNRARAVSVGREPAAAPCCCRSSLHGLDRAAQGSARAGAPRSIANPSISAEPGDADDGYGKSLPCRRLADP